MTALIFRSNNANWKELNISSCEVSPEAERRTDVAYDHFDQFRLFDFVNFLSVFLLETRQSK